MDAFGTQAFRHRCRILIVFLRSFYRYGLSWRSFVREEAFRRGQSSLTILEKINEVMRHCGVIPGRIEQSTNAKQQKQITEIRVFSPLLILPLVMSGMLESVYGR